MIRLTCPKCGNVTEHSEAFAGQAQTCPQCGNVNVVPPAAGPAAAPGAGPAPGVTPVPPGPAPTLPEGVRLRAMACHLGSLVKPILFGWIIVPLVVWLTQRDKHPYIDEQGKQSLNFQLSMTLYAVVAAGLCFVIVGFVLLAALMVLEVVFLIKAILATHAGRPFQYPLSIRFVK